MKGLAKVKKKKTRKPWGLGRIPVLQHLMSQCRALGHERFDREKVWAVLLEQIARERKSFPVEERKFQRQYVNIFGMRPAGQKAVMSQLEILWGGKPKTIKKRATPKRKAATKKAAKPKGPPPPPPNAVSAAPRPQTTSAPPPPPNAVSARPAPPPPPNAVESKPTPKIGDLLAVTWEEVFGETIPPLPEKTGQSIGTLYGENAGKKVEVHGHDKRVCLSIKFQLPEDQAKVIEAVREGLESLDPFGACLMAATHSRRPDGFWVDLLIHYSVEVVDLYKSVLSCDLVLDAEANPADAFGKTAQHGEALD